ncbi:hypothetical protein ABR738_05340 [Streptomyces sp. Edi4]
MDALHYMVSSGGHGVYSFGLARAAAFRSGAAAGSRREGDD